MIWLAVAAGAALALARDGHPGQAVLNVAGQVGLSLLGVWAGFRLAD